MPFSFGAVIKASCFSAVTPVSGWNQWVKWVAPFSTAQSFMAAATALASCGIAYVLKYIQAATQAGIEMGLRPKDAMQMIAQSLKGAAALIQNNDTHPSVEIDKVTTPGGITIKGINELEHNGFTSAVIKAMKASK